METTNVRYSLNWFIHVVILHFIKWKQKMWLIHDLIRHYWHGSVDSHCGFIVSHKAWTDVVYINLVFFSTILVLFLFNENALLTSIKAFMFCYVFQYEPVSIVALQARFFVCFTLSQVLLCFTLSDVLLLHSQPVFVVLLWAMSCCFIMSHVLLFHHEPSFVMSLLNFILGSYVCFF